MSNPRLTQFWAEVQKLSKSYEDDELVVGVYVIDSSNHVCEINGDKVLKQILYDFSSKINQKWKEESVVL